MALSILLILFSLAWHGVRSSSRALHAHAEARRLVAAALRVSGPEAEQRALLRQARKIDPTSAASDCEKGWLQEHLRHYAEAARSFQACAESDPEQAYAHFAYARVLLRAHGKESYGEARNALRLFLETMSQSHSLRPDPASQRSAQELTLDLEELLVLENPALPQGSYSAEDLILLLTRPTIRGGSRYEGPRAPLHLDFRPGDTSLGALAEAQLRQVARALRDGLLADARIQIEGHTDSVEGKSRAERLALSRKRAEAVKQFLVKCCGISSSRLLTAVLADDYPLRSNQTAEGRATNRRVELVNLDEKVVLRGDVRDGG